MARFGVSVMASISSSEECGTLTRSQHATIRDLLVSSRGRFTSAEVKVMRTLVANYPAAGLGTAGRLAREAGVSDPTVVRFVAKLGFSGYPAFQQQLLSEVEAHMASPLTMFERRNVHFGDDPCRAAMSAAVAGVEVSLTTLLAADIFAAVAFVSDPRARVFCLGGRFSRNLAAILHAHLIQLRAGVSLLPGAASDLSDALVDLRAGDVLVVFDYRRWQTDVVSFAEQAAAAGARLVLFTDPWRSPIAKVAGVVLVSPVESSSPFDTMVPALALVEGLIAAMTAQANKPAHVRISSFERFRAANRITLDAPVAAAGVQARPKRPRSAEGR
jgi:DNA-binding MurR/RpiR family transcriptional regulator